jgi:acyl-ACP thioesterase|tara:strand:+ start:61 stop:333 length:273 start_codon:yes stop_codon:yes gene_type:complete
MSEEDYMLEMCSSKASWQVVPKRIEAINLKEVAAKIIAAGWSLRIETRFCYIFEGKAKLTLYPSGKLLVKTETNEMAREIAKLHATEWVV